MYINWNCVSVLWIKYCCNCFQFLRLEIQILQDDICVFTLCLLSPSVGLQCLQVFIAFRQRQTPSSCLVELEMGLFMGLCWAGREMGLGRLALLLLLAGMTAEACQFLEGAEDHMSLTVSEEDGYRTMATVFLFSLKWTTMGILSS